MTVNPDPTGVKDFQRPQPVWTRVCKLVAVTAQATVAARIVTAVSLRPLRSGRKNIGEDFFTFKLRHQPGATRHLVITYDRGLIRSLPTGYCDVQAVVRYPRRVHSTQQERIGHRIRIPLVRYRWELKAHDISGQFVAEREPLQGTLAVRIRR